MEVGEEEREGNEVFVEISGRKVREIWKAAFSDIEDKPMIIYEEIFSQFLQRRKCQM